jgi:hypothetical protein
VETTIDWQPHKMFKIESPIGVPFMLTITNQNGVRKVHVHYCNKVLQIFLLSVIDSSFHHRHGEQACKKGCRVVDHTSTSCRCCQEVKIECQKTKV